MTKIISYTVAFIMAGLTSSAFTLNLADHPSTHHSRPAVVQYQEGLDYTK